LEIAKKLIFVYNNMFPANSNQLYTINQLKLAHKETVNESSGSINSSALTLTENNENKGNNNISSTTELDCGNDVFSMFNPCDFNLDDD